MVSSSVHCLLHSSHKDLALRPINSKLLRQFITFTTQQKPISTPSKHSVTNCAKWCHRTYRLKVKIDQSCDNIGLNQTTNGAARDGPRGF
jgi:hypothetical protein